MGASWVYAVLGLLAGFLSSLFLSALLLSWPIRTLLVAVLLGFVSIACIRPSAEPRYGWRLAGGWFALGCALGAAILVALEFLFPPLT